jgi:putative transcriptional regulator
MSKATTLANSSKSSGPLTDEEITRAALADPDAQPLTKEDLARMKRVPRAKIIRQALDLTQEEFATRYRIPLGTLRDWEQGRSEPDLTAMAYLLVIGTEPDVVARALAEERVAGRLNAYAAQKTQQGGPA